ncbi:MAG: winged helix-turn-helix domain-containing protein [Blastocatellia bacterium]
MERKLSGLYEFGPFRLDADERLLLRGGETVALPPKTFDLLLALVGQPGHLLEKETLLKTVWPDSFVEENNLADNISKLRKALGEGENGQKFIETVPKRGYRFIAAVRRVTSENKVAPDSAEITGPQISSAFHFEGAPGGEVALVTGRHEAQQHSGTERKEIKLPRPPATRSPLRKLFWLAALLTFGALVGIVFTWYRPVRLPSPQFEAKNLSRITSNGNIRAAAISPDGKFVAYIQQEGANRSLRIRHLATAGETQILAPATHDLRTVNFSPDGNLIYYIVGQTRFRGTLFQISLLGGQPRKIIEDIYLVNLGVSGISFAPGGKQFAFLRISLPPASETSSLIIADADGTSERTLISFKRPELLLGSPAWSPDGGTIACPFQNTLGMNVLAIKVANTASAARLLPVEINAVSQIAWQPDGLHLLMVAEDDTETTLYQIYQCSAADGARRRISRDFNNYESLSLSADGRNLITVRTEQIAHLWTMPTDNASLLRQLTHGFEKYDGVNGLGWLADSKIFYESMPGGKQAIWQIDPGDGGEKQMATGGSFGAAAPNGRWLVYQKSLIRDHRLVQGLFLFDSLDGSERQLTSGWDLWAEFTPDGQAVNFIRWGEDPAMATLRRVPVAGGAPVHLTRFLAITAATSPDGKSIAVSRWEAAKTQIAIIPASGGDPTKIFEMDFRIQDRFGKRPIQWTPDGRSIAFIRESNGVSNLWQQAIDGGDPFPLTSFTADLIFNFAFSPGGRQLALSRGTINSDVILISN